MKITIAAVSQRPSEWVETACAEYLKRLPNDWTVDFKIIKPAPRQADKTVSQNMLLEAQRLETALKGVAGIRIALDERGKSLTTHSFLELLETNQETFGGVILIIGGPDGLDPTFKQSCSIKIQLSAMTLPHALVKVLLIEQIYRACSIAAGHPYHRN